MSLSELLKKEVIRETKPDSMQAALLIKKAERNLKAARSALDSNNPDWALAIAYNAMLSAGRGLMAARGYRPSADAHHIAVVQFCSLSLPKEANELVSSFNRYRTRRHEVVYGEIETVGRTEAEHAIEKADLLVKSIKTKI